MGLALLLFLGQTLLWGVPSWATEEAEALCSGTACYTIHWGKHNWMGAQGECQRNGGNLVTMKNQEEAMHIQDLLAKLPQREAEPEGPAKLWIGLHREKGICYQQHQLLKGFRWVSGGEEESHYSAWLREPRGTCTARRCVTLHWDPPAPGSSRPGWTDGSCSGLARGYLCKFSFQGMCPPLVLAGPGSVAYRTPFGLASTSLGAVPFGSLAEVSCRPPAEPSGTFAMCQGQAGGFDWSSRDPLCASPGGCAELNGGCAHLCLERPDGAVRCACRPGWALGPDRMGCLLQAQRPEPAPTGRPPWAATASTPRLADTSTPRPEDPSTPRMEGTSTPRLADTSTPRPEDPSTPRMEGTSTPRMEGTSTPRPVSTSTPRLANTSTPKLADTSTPNAAGTIAPDAAGTSTLWLAINSETVAGGPKKSGLDTVPDGPKLLLYYILGTVVVILLLMAFALGLLICRKRRGQKEKKKSRSATDNYCWVPEQAERN
uniref:CD93 molecule n=1 Tax=Pelusios castaneus TaxID=367368 RepID=A0A8C8S515_9SAUR